MPWLKRTHCAESSPLFILLLKADGLETHFDRCCAADGDRSLRGRVSAPLCLTESPSLCSQAAPAQVHQVFRGGRLRQQRNYLLTSKLSAWPPRGVASETRFNFASICFTFWPPQLAQSDSPDQTREGRREGASSPASCLLQGAPPRPPSLV